MAKAKEKDNKIIVLKKDKQTIVINGKRNNIYTIPAAGLALVVKEINIKLVDIYKKKAKTKGIFTMPMVYSFAGLASSLLAKGIEGDLSTFVTSCSLGLLVAGIVGVVRGIIETSKLKKEEKRYQKILEVLGDELILREMCRKEDFTLALKILNESIDIIRNGREEKEAELS
ncbi:MAG: hypothetical protein J6A28_03630 [Clostridia bacterium]|nr:hypothetical protein [Clostridia bacterium]